MKNKYCYICLYSDYEDKEYYLTSVDFDVCLALFGIGYKWGNKKDALIFKSKNIAKWYLKDLNNKCAYIKELGLKDLMELI